MWWLALFACGTPATPPAPAPAPPQEEPSAQPTWVLPALEPVGDRPADCPLALDGLSPKLKDPQQGKAPVQVTRDGRLVEAFTWPNGVPVRVIQEGCAHIGITEQYGLAAEPADLYAKAVELSGALETLAGQSSHVERLKAAGGLGADGTFPCGEAHCQVTLRADGPNPVLEIRYDFAL